MEVADRDLMACYREGEALNKRLFRVLRELRATSAAPRHSPIGPFYSAMLAADAVLRESWPTLGD